MERNVVWRFLRGLCFFFSFFGRYRIGDVVKVVGFHHQCPIVEFQYRYIVTHSGLIDDVLSHLDFISLDGPADCTPLSLFCLSDEVRC